LLVAAVMADARAGQAFADCVCRSACGVSVRAVAAATNCGGAARPFCDASRGRPKQFGRCPETLLGYLAMFVEGSREPFSPLLTLLFGRWLQLLNSQIEPTTSQTLWRRKRLSPSGIGSAKQSQGKGP
jgi:hypothetical protein